MTQSVVCASDSFASSCFTGKERDAESGNDHFGTRCYAIYDCEDAVPQLSCLTSGVHSIRLSPVSG